MRYVREILESGLRVLVAPTRDTETATVLVFVAAGSKYETKATNGISHFLEHLCFKGTTDRTTPLAVSHAFDELGAENNAFTAEEYTGYYAKAHSKHIDTIIELVADIYLHSTLPKEEIDRERGVVIEEINLYNDRPTWHAEDLITDLLYGNQPAGWEVLGTKENIRRLQRATIARYREEHYVAGGTVVVVAGNVTPQKTIKRIRQAFENIPKGKQAAKKDVVERQTKPTVGVRYRKTDQAHLILGIRTVPFTHKDVWVLHVLATLMGGGMSSRLFTRLRDELGLCYYVNATNRFFTDHGYMAIRAGVAKDRADEAVVEILRVCRHFTENKVTAKELRKAKNYAVGTMYLSLEATDALAWSYGSAEMLGREVLTPAARAKKIRAVTRDDIQRVAQRYFKGDNLNLAVAGPYKKGDQFKRVLDL